MSLALDALPSIAFIGGGNMAQALIGGLRAGGMPATSIQVVEPHGPTADRVGRAHGIRAIPVPGAAIAQAGVLVLAVKPQAMREACAAARSYLRPDVLVVSVAAGIRTDDLVRWLGCARIVRTMPNTPALIRAGMTGLWARTEVAAAGRAIAEAMLASVGRTLWVDDESMLDAVTAVSGSGPAYVFRFIEALQDAARELGFDENDARMLATATFEGASRLAADSLEPAAVLRERVTSKGGTTHAALVEMERRGMPEAIAAGVRAAAERGRALGDEFGRE